MSFKIPALPTTLPTEPYIVTTPSDTPFSTPDWQRDNWRIAGWFEPHEKYLQYQTFIWRDPSESLFQLKTAYEMRAGPAEAMKKEKEARNAGKVGNVGVNAAKKKISLSDYKKKASLAPAQVASDTERLQPTNEDTIAEVPSGEPIPTPRVDQPSANAKAKLQTTTVLSPAGGNAVGKPPHEPGANKTDEVKAMEPRKRRLSEVASTMALHPQSKKSRTEDMPSKQGPDVAPDTSSQSSRSDTRAETKPIHKQPITGAAISREPHPPAKMPGVFLPSWRGHGEGAVRKPSTLPTPPHHEDNMPRKQHDLPKWLTSKNRSGSSTPPRLPNEFRKIDRTPPGRFSVPQRAQPTQVLSPPPSTSSPDSVRMSVTYSSNSSVGGDQVEEKMHATPVRGIARKRAPQDKGVDETYVLTTKETAPETTFKPMAAVERDSDKQEVSSEAEEEELLVKLKFSKGLRMNVQRILQLKPSPRTTPQNRPAQELSRKEKTSAADAETSDRKDEDVKHTQRPDTKESYVPPMDRQKVDLPAVTAAPHTPQPLPTPRSPVHVTPSSSLHRQVLTPRKDKDLSKKSSVSSLFQVARNSSSSTPQKPLPSTPTATTGTQTNTTTPQSANRAAQSAKWHAEYKRLAETGRALKHRMTAVLKKGPSSAASSSDKALHLAALCGLESLLAFMLSFVAREHAYAPDRRAKYVLETYPSMTPFGKEVTRACASWSHLAAMAELLLGSCQAAVVQAAGELGGFPDSAPPVKDAGAAASEPATTTRDEKNELAKLTRAIKDMQRHAQMAVKGLPLDVMRKQYPAAAKEAEKVSPLGCVGLRPAAAVKMGKMFLEEYTAKSAARDVGWKGTLEIGDAGEL